MSLLCIFPKGLVTRACSSCVTRLKRLFRCIGNDSSNGHRRVEPEGQACPDLTVNIAHSLGRPYAISPCCDLFKRDSRDYGTVVIRRIRFQDDETLAEKLLKDTALSLIGARNVHVVPYLGTCEFEGSLCVVSPFAQGGDLKTYLRTFPDCNRVALLLQVARGLEYLHRSGVTHGNLHTRNVVLSEDQTVQLSDFGLSEIIPDEGTTSMRSAFCREKAMHRAPEFHMGEPLSPKCDVYSFGMLVFYMFSDKEPMIDSYPGAIQVVAALLARHRPDRSEITRSDFPDDLWVTVQRCWAHAQEKRPTALGVLVDLGDTEPAPGNKGLQAKWWKFP